MAAPELSSILGIVLNSVPSEWAQIRVCYQNFEGHMRILNHFKGQENDSWNAFNYSGFECMDIFEEFESKENINSKEPWTSITLVFNQSKEMTIEYGYGDPSMYEV